MDFFFLVINISLEKSKYAINDWFVVLQVNFSGLVTYIELNSLFTLHITYLILWNKPL